MGLNKAEVKPEAVQAKLISNTTFLTKSSLNQEIDL